MLAEIIERVGPFKLQYREPTFQTLVRSIVYQQLSGKAALTIFNRLTAASSSRIRNSYNASSCSKLRGFTSQPLRGLTSRKPSLCSR